MTTHQNGMIDYWCNGFTPDKIAEWDLALETSPLGFPPEKAATLAEPEAFLNRMTDEGVRAVVVPSVIGRLPDPHGVVPQLEFQADFTHRLSAEFPGRVYGLFSIDPREAAAGVRNLERSVREYGFIGAQIHTHSWDRPLDHRDYYPYYAKCEELGVPVIAEVGHSAGLFPSECGRPMTVDRVVIYFKELRFVLSHMGYPWTDEAIAIAWKHPNAYLGTATHQPGFWPTELKEFVAGRGRNKVLLGTGFPVLGHGALLSQVEALGLPAEVRDGLVFKNAARVFALDVDAAPDPAGGHRA